MPNPNFLHYYIKHNFWPSLQGPGGISEDRISYHVQHVFTRARNELASWDRSQTQVHPGSLTQYYVVRGVKGGALSSLPVCNLRGATGKGIGANCNLSFCLWGKVQQVSASVLSGKDFMLGAALKHTDGKKERWGERWTKIKNSEGSQERWKNPVQNSRGSLGRMPCGPHPVHRRVLSKRSEPLIWTVQSNICRDTSKSTQSIQTALLQWLAFSFQRMLGEKAFLTFQRGVLTHNTQKQEQVKTHAEISKH